MKKHLIEQVKRLPNGQKINVAVQNSGVYLPITAEQAINLLYNDTPNWHLSMYEESEDYNNLQVWLYVEEGEGCGAYANPPTMDDLGNLI